MFADGNPQARVMFVGEAPGRDEDLEGLPFVGRSGKLLDRMMAAIGLDRTERLHRQHHSVAPARQPHADAAGERRSACPSSQRQIELANPDILVCLGGPSAQTLLGVKEGIKRTRGNWFAFHTGTREIRAIATFHPAYLLRSPLEKRFAWRDFLAVKKALGVVRLAYAPVRPSDFGTPMHAFARHAERGGNGAHDHNRIEPSGGRRCPPYPPRPAP